MYRLADFVKLLKKRTTSEEDTPMVLIYCTHLKTWNLELKVILWNFAKVVGLSLLWMENLAVIEPYFSMLISSLVCSYIIVQFLLCQRSALAYPLGLITHWTIPHEKYFFFFSFLFSLTAQNQTNCLCNCCLIGRCYPNLFKCKRKCFLLYIK